LSTIKKFDAPIEQVTTSSLEALRQYSQGVEQHSKADYERAIPFYQRAIVIDPYFAIAHARLALCYNNIRQFENARTEYKRAYELRDRVSEREKFVIAANYYGGVTGEWDAQIKELETWKITYPRDWEPLNLLCNKFTLVGPFQKAVDEGHAAINLKPKDPRAYVNLAVAFMGLNRFEESLQTLRDAQTQKLESGNMHLRLYHLAFMQGDQQAMKDQLDWVNVYGRREEALNLQAQSAAFSGELARADALNDQMIEMNRTNEARAQLAQILSTGAIRDASLGNCARATDLAKQSLDLSREQADLVTAGNVYAACGQAALAGALVDELI